MELSSPTFPALGQSPLASQAPELPYSYTGLIDLPLCHALLSIAAGCRALLADAGVQGSCPTLTELCCLCTLGLAWRFFFFFQAGKGCSAAGTIVETTPRSAAGLNPPARGTPTVPAPAPKEGESFPLYLCPKS